MIPVDDQVYSNTRVRRTNVSTSQQESTRLRSESTRTNTSPTRINTSPALINTNQQELTRFWHKSTRVRIESTLFNTRQITSQMNYNVIMIYHSLIGNVWWLLDWTYYKVYPSFYYPFKIKSKSGKYREKREIFVKFFSIPGVKNQFIPQEWRPYGNNLLLLCHQSVYTTIPR